VDGKEKERFSRLCREGGPDNHDIENKDSMKYKQSMSNLYSKFAGLAKSLGSSRSLEELGCHPNHLKRNLNGMQNIHIQ
jgi:hypothetical protein